MQLADLPKVTTEQVATLAAIAAITGAIIAVVGAVTTAYINRVSSRLLARDQARREFRTKDLEPFKQALNKSIVHYHDIMRAGPEIATKMQRAIDKAKNAADGRLPPGSPDLIAVMEILNKLETDLVDSKQSMYDVGYYGQLFRDQRLIDATTRWLTTKREFYQKFQDVGGITANLEKLKELDRLAWKALLEAGRLRMEMEEFIIHRSWWKSVWYRIRRKTGTVDK